MKNPFQKQTSVTLPGAVVATLLPKGWTLESGRRGVLTIIGPERDLRVGFGTARCMEMPKRWRRTAWQRFDANFDLPVLQRAQAPGENGWDEIFQIVYDTPRSSHEAP